MLSFHCRTWGSQCWRVAWGAAAERQLLQPWSKTLPSPALETTSEEVTLPSAMPKRFLKGLIPPSVLI